MLLNKITDVSSEVKEVVAKMGNGLASTQADRDFFGKFIKPIVEVRPIPPTVPVTFVAPVEIPLKPDELIKVKEEPTLELVVEDEEEVIELDAADDDPTLVSNIPPSDVIIFEEIAEEEFLGKNELDVDALFAGVFDNEASRADEDDEWAGIDDEVELTEDTALVDFGRVERSIPLLLSYLDAKQFGSMITTVDSLLGVC